MPKAPIVSTITWGNIPISISYLPISSKIYDNRVVSHIEVRSNEPIPITETGYKSIFFFQEEDDILSSVTNIILEQIKKESLSKEWKEYQKEQQQPSLF